MEPERPSYKRTLLRLYHTAMLVSKWPCLTFDKSFGRDSLVENAPSVVA